MSISIPLSRWIAVTAILIGCCHAGSLAHAKTEESGKPAVKYDTSQFTPRFLYPGGEVVLTVDALTQPEERVMTLTFDDGPDEQDLALSELLKQHETPATFFYVGSKVKLLPEVVRKIHASQYEIGYHSFRHQRVKWFSQASLLEDFRQGKEALNSLGVPVNFFRPPYGDFNEHLVRTAKEQGMETVLWSIDSRDWTGISAETMAKNVIRHFHPGAVLLFHSQHPVTLRAMPLVLEAAEREGYRFVSLGDWRRVVLAANCRVEKGTSCPSAPTFASRAPTRSTAKPSASHSSESPAAKPPAKGTEATPVEVPAQEGGSEDGMRPAEAESADSLTTRDGSEGNESPIISSVVESVVPVLTPISIVRE
ncbi:MAG: polysaccharide deacetylase family protein [Magnetococcales bacterium]|nr:polysaccharide deacetylase family protein [Magnetococcales bacterium]